jgi:small subunit ribosomal protein S21
MGVPESRAAAGSFLGGRLCAAAIRTDGHVNRTLLEAVQRVGCGSGRVLLLPGRCHPRAYATGSTDLEVHRLLVQVRDNNVDQALKALKKKMQREGIFREMKLRNYYEKPSEKRVREQAEAVRRARKLARKRAQREGLLPGKAGRTSGQRSSAPWQHRHRRSSPQRRRRWLWRWWRRLRRPPVTHRRRPSRRGIAFEPRSSERGFCVLAITCAAAASARRSSP